MTNCWIHGTGSEPGNKKLETVEIKRGGDYANNIKLVLAPNEEELYLKTLKQLREERIKTSQLETEINNKEQRITQLDGLLKGSALIFQKQQQVIDQLTEKLNKEIEQNVGNVDYQAKLQVDVKRLAGERKEITERLKELTEEEKKNKDLKDQQILALKQEKDRLLTQKQQEIERLMKEVVELNDKLKKADESKQSLAEEMKPKCLRTDELRDCKIIRHYLQKSEIETMTPLEINKYLQGEIKTLKFNISNGNLPILGYVRRIPITLEKLLEYIAQLTRERDNRPNIDLPSWTNDYSQRPSKSELTYLNSKVSNLEIELAKERGWWDKWLVDESRFLFPIYRDENNIQKIHFLNPSSVKYDENIKDKNYIINNSFLWIWSDFHSSIDKFQLFDQNLKKSIKDKIYQYYLDK